MKNIKFFIFKHKNLSLTNSFGIYKSYFETGKLRIEAQYINNKKNGIYKEYYNDGQLYREINYIDDVAQ